MDAVLIVKVRGMANTLYIIDFIKKNTYLRLERILLEKKFGELNIIFSGATGQINEAEQMLNDFLNYKHIKFKLSKILNFSDEILSADGEYFDI